MTEKVIAFGESHKYGLSVSSEAVQCVLQINRNACSDAFKRVCRLFKTLIKKKVILRFKQSPASGL